MVRRLSKASSTQSFDGSGSARGRLFGRSFATRGVSPNLRGGGASAGRRLARLTAPLALTAFAALFAFGVPIAAAASCPNEALRIENNSLTLPECRAYELVTHDDTGGLGIVGIDGVSDSGSQVLLRAQTIGVPKSLAGQWTPYVYDRASSGWDLRQLGIDPEYFAGESLGGYWYGSDFSVLWSKAKQSQYKRAEVQFTVTHPDGSANFASPLIKPLEYVGSAEPGTYQSNQQGQSPDLSTFVFEFQHASNVGVKFFPDEPLVNGSNNISLYQVTDADTPSPTFSLLNRDPTGAPVVNVCAANVGAESGAGIRTHAISTDGSIVYFSVRPGAPVTGSCSTGVKTASPLRVFKRVNATSTVEVSKSQCTRVAPTPCSAANGDDNYQGASADGSKVFFSTVRQLTDSDEDATADLYLYDTAPPIGQPQLTQVTVGEVTAGHPSLGKGAEVLGVVDNAADGSRIYFVAKGQLTAAATAGANNLYVYERDAAHPTGRLAFVAGLGAADSPLWSAGFRASWAQPFYGPGGIGDGDGRLLLFSSAAQLVAEDTDAINDLYRYDDATSALQCVTCLGNGAFPARAANGGGRSVSSSPGNYVQRYRTGSEDLSAVVFETAEQLLPEDQNSVDDIYQWREGTVSLISGGTGATGSVGAISSGEYFTMSPDGQHVYFVTNAQVVPSDTNTAPDVYDAFVGGGFPQPVEVAPCASEQACHPQPAQPPAPSTDASTTFVGPGNEQVPAAKRCPKGKVRKHGACVKKKPKHKQRRHHRRTSRDSRGAK